MATGASLSSRFKALSSAALLLPLISACGSNDEPLSLAVMVAANEFAVAAKDMKPQQKRAAATVTQGSFEEEAEGEEDLAYGEPMSPDSSGDGDDSGNGSSDGDNGGGYAGAPDLNPVGAASSDDGSSAGVSFNVGPDGSPPQTLPPIRNN